MTYALESVKSDSNFDIIKEVVWRADRVEINSTEFSDQGLTRYNGDHDWACGVNYPTNKYNDLQT